MTKSNSAIYRFIILIILLSFILLVLQNAFTTYAYEIGFDVVVVLDCSGSMQYTDPNKLALSGAKMFLDNLTRQNRSFQSRYGAVIFEGEIHTTIPLMNISSPTVVEEIKNTLDTSYHQIGYWTDIPRALSRALRMFEESGTSNGNIPIIVLLTDGDDDPSSSRSMSELNAERESVIRNAKERGIRIYTIGLNENGGRFEMDPTHITEIAERTDAKMFETNTSERLQLIFTEIFADIIGSSSDDYNYIFPQSGQLEIELAIPDSYVYGAFVNITSLRPISVIVKDPLGVEQVEQPSRLSIDPSEKYTSVYIQNPEKGVWSLTISGTPDTSFQTSLVYNYDLRLNMSIGGREVLNVLMEPDEPIPLSVWLEDAHGRVNDTDIYNAVDSLIITVMDEKGKRKDCIPVPENNSYLFDLQEIEIVKGSYTINAQLNHTYFSKELPSMRTLVIGDISPHSTTTTITPEQPSNSLEQSLSHPILPDEKIGLPLWLIIVIVLSILLIGMVFYFRLVRTPSINLQPLPAMKFVITRNMGEQEKYFSESFNPPKRKIKLGEHLLSINSNCFNGETVVMDRANGVILLGVREGIIYDNKNKDVKIQSDEKHIISGKCMTRDNGLSFTSIELCDEASTRIDVSIQN